MSIISSWGRFFFLLLLLLEKAFSFSDKKSNVAFVFYHVGLNMTCIMFLVRGILEVTGQDLTPGINGMVSGLAGIGHIVLGVSLVLLLIFLFLKVLRRAKRKPSQGVGLPSGPGGASSGLPFFLDRPISPDHPKACLATMTAMISLMMGAAKFSSTGKE